MDPEKIARRLLAFAREVEPQDVEVSSVPRAAEDMEMWRREFRLDDDIAAPLWEVMGTLKMALDETDWDPDVSDIPQAERDRWTFGEALKLRGSPRDIVRGFLQPLRVEPMLRRVPDSIALYLIHPLEARSRLPDDHFYGESLPDSFAQSEWQILAEAAVQSSISERRILVESRRRLRGALTHTRPKPQA